jgi:GABA permease
VWHRIDACDETPHPPLERDSGLALTFGSLTALLIVAGVLTAFAVDPPARGWLGFAIVSFVVLGLGVVATLVVPRLRVSPVRPAVATDQERRLLVVADPDCRRAGLCDEIETHLEAAVAVHVVVPVRVSHLHFLANDESEERRSAERATSIAVELLRQRGIAATGSVGSDKPLESMTDALGAFPATDVLLVTPPAAESYWLERDLLMKARGLTELPVSQVVVASTRRHGSPVRLVDARRERAS